MPGEGYAALSDLSGVVIEILESRNSALKAENAELKVAVRAREVENSIYEGLRGLEWYCYLRSMWLICGEMRELYSARMPSSESNLVTSTLDLVREVAISEEVSPGAIQESAALKEGWIRLMDDEESNFGVYPGHWNMRIIFRNLAFEIGDNTQRYFACGRVFLALSGRFREGKKRDLSVDPDEEEIDDESPLAQQLVRIQRIVEKIVPISDFVKDPAVARGMIFSSN